MLRNLGESIIDKKRKNKKVAPAFYYTPDISPIINDLLSSYDITDKTAVSKVIKLSFKVLGGEQNEVNKVIYQTTVRNESKYPVVTLEIFRSIYDVFLGKELLGRITDKSVTVNMYSLIDMQIYVEYGEASGEYIYRSKGADHYPRERPIEIVLSNLYQNKKYYYRIAYKLIGGEDYIYGEEHTFHTARPKGSKYNFSIISDEHALARKLALTPVESYSLNYTLNGISSDRPDFLISLGDSAITGFGQNSVRNVIEAKERYIYYREFLDTICHSIPFYFVLGNHESENGWDKKLAKTSLAARKMLIPNPTPDDFFSGNNELLKFVGFRENYYSWEWGDSLFVVLDPYSYTERKPMMKERNSSWQWTLGRRQYDWLNSVLNASGSKWKFIFIHQLFGEGYGRGGIEVAKYKVDNQPSFEWGGEDINGDYVFENKRAGWEHGAIHDILVANDVTAVFHGHDHMFVMQELDGVVYQSAPFSSFTSVNIAHFVERYKVGVIKDNYGYLNVKVEPDVVVVEYIKIEDENQSEIEYSYSIQ